MKIVHYLLLLVLSIALLKTVVVHGNGDFHYSYIPEENVSAGKRLYTDDKNIDFEAYAPAHFDVDVISNIEIKNVVDVAVGGTRSDEETHSISDTREVKSDASNNITTDNGPGLPTNSPVVRSECHNGQECSGDEMDDITMEFLSNLMEPSTEKKNNTFFQKNDASQINGDNSDDKKRNSVDGGDEKIDHTNIVDEQFEIIANAVPVDGNVSFFDVDKTAENNYLNGKSANPVALTEGMKKTIRALIAECASLYLNTLSSTAHKFTDKKSSDSEWWLPVKTFFDAIYSGAKSNTSSNDMHVYSDDAKAQDSNNGSSNKNVVRAQNDNEKEEKQLKIKKCNMLLSKLLHELSAGNIGVRDMMSQLNNDELVGKVSRGYLRWAKPEVEGSGGQKDAMSFLETLLQNENEADTREKHSVEQYAFVDHASAGSVEDSKKFKIEDRADTTRKIDGTSVKVKSMKVLNNGEKKKKNNFAVHHIKKEKNGSFLEHPEEAQDLLNSEMTSRNYVREASENAFDDNETIDSPQKTSVTDGNVQNKVNAAAYANSDISQKVTSRNDVQLNTLRHTDQMSFVEHRGTHEKSSSSDKKDKGKHISKKKRKSPKHHSNNSRNVHKRNAEVKKHSHKTDTTNKSHSKGHSKPHVKEDKEKDTKQDEDEDEDEDEVDEEEEEDEKEDTVDEHEDNDENDDKNNDVEKDKKGSSNSKHGENEKSYDKEKDTNTKITSDTDNAHSSAEGTEKKNSLVEHEVDNINKYRKVYDVNLYNCSLIKDWDFTHEYVDEQGTLVKLSGYIFQNTLNSNSMPTSNIDEWKLKGVCEFEKYVCGALKYMPNQYSKGERVIFEEQVYEALITTTMSPKDDASAWVDKTNDCSEE